MQWSCGKSKPTALTPASRSQTAASAVIQGARAQKSGVSMLARSSQRVFRMAMSPRLRCAPAAAIRSPVMAVFSGVSERSSTAASPTVMSRLMASVVKPSGSTCRGLSMWVKPWTFHPAHVPCPSPSACVFRRRRSTGQRKWPVVTGVERSISRRAMAQSLQGRSCQSRRSVPASWCTRRVNAAPSMRRRGW